MARLLALFAAAFVVAACDEAVDARGAEIASVLVANDQALLASRRSLVEAKYARMARSPYQFYRGSLALFVHDAAQGRSDPFQVAIRADATPFSIGDAHVENFGTFAVDDGFVVEPNDCDAADRWSYLFELRRLTVALGVATHVSNPGDDAARNAAVLARKDVVRGAARGYAEEIRRISRGEASELAPSKILDDLVERSQKDVSPPSELTERTQIVDGARRLVRGAIDEDDPQNAYVDVPEVVREALAGAISTYATHLADPPSSSFFHLDDAVREVGSGVASYPRARFIVLVSGPTDSLDDDVLLEVKELGDSGAPPIEPPHVVEDDVTSRVARCANEVVGEPARDPLWGTTTLLGLPVQIRRDREAHKTLRTSRFRDELGTSEAMSELAAALGQRLARVHARSGKTVVRAIRADIGLRSRFVEEEAAFADDYTARVVADYARFRLLLDELGPALGFRSQGESRLDPEVAALLGVAPAGDVP